MFHPSCSTKKNKNCCETQNLSEKNQNNDEDNLDRDDILNDSIIEKSIQWENKILKELNAELRQNNMLLKEKIENMEVEIASLREDHYQSKKKTWHSRSGLK